MSAGQKSAWGKRLRYSKGRRHGHVTQRANGHYCFKNICKRYKKRLGRELRPAELAHIRAAHAEEIEKAKIGAPWEKRPRVWYPEL